MKRHFSAAKFAKIFAFAVVMVIGFGFIVMGLWNYVLVPVLHISTVSFWQALGIFVLAKILFGGFHGPYRGHRWDRRMRERWAGMSPEEREKFRQKFRDRCRRFSGEGGSFEEQTEPVK